MADEQFAHLESLVTRPNLFKIVARTHTETWHSMFLGWLLDPSGSHGINDFSLKRLLVALGKANLSEGDTEKINKILKIALVGELSNADVRPNESNQKEVEIKNVGKFDVLITGIKCKGESDTVILIEQKVHAPIDKDQCKKYADWLYKTYPNENKILLMIAPRDRLGTSIENTIGDTRWNAIDYQTLHDRILIQITKLPDLSQITLPLINQYIDTLRIPSNGRKLAVTEEEKNLALDLYDKHREAFQSIFAALMETGEIEPIKISEDSISLSVTINNVPIVGKTVKNLYENVLKYLVDNELIPPEQVPFATSSSRYLINRENAHQKNNKFKDPIEYKGFYMETNKDKKNAINHLMKFLKEIKCDSTTLNGL